MLSAAFIVAMRDMHLPSQGESFDCLAFARDIESAVIAERIAAHERDTALLDWIAQHDWRAEQCFEFFGAWMLPDGDCYASLRATIEAAIAREGEAM